MIHFPFLCGLLMYSIDIAFVLFLFYLQVKIFLGRVFTELISWQYIFINQTYLTLIEKQQNSKFILNIYGKHNNWILFYCKANVGKIISIIIAWNTLCPIFIVSFCIDFNNKFYLRVHAKNLNEYAYIYFVVVNRVFQKAFRFVLCLSIIGVCNTF